LRNRKGWRGRFKEGSKKGVRNKREGRESIGRSLPNKRDRDRRRRGRRRKRKRWKGDV
jgi:hypothetical protein